MSVRLLLLVFCAHLVQAQNSGVTVHEEVRTFPTYDVGAPDPNPQFDAFRRNQFPSYPYAIIRPVDQTPSLSQWRVVVLENEYLSCRILPDLGGHLHGCTDRITGKEIFFANPVIRRTEDQTRGGFASTGIETSFPIAHNRMSGWPVAYAWSLSDGIGRVIVEDTDLPTGMRWRAEFILRPGSAVLEQRGTVYNGSPVRRGYQWWVNAAVEVDDPKLRAIYPTNWMMPHGEGEMTSWPIDKKGVDLSVANNNVAMFGFFSHLSHEPWMAIYKPAFRSGVAHYADLDSIKGKKLWVWGTGDDAKYFREKYSEASRMCVEMQAGELESQPEFSFLLPGETKTFSHYWIPFHDLSGVSRATPDAVLNLNRQGHSVTVELQSTHVMKGVTLRLSEGGKSVWENPVDLDPRLKFTQTVEAAKLTVDLLNKKGVALLHHVEGELDAAPFDRNAKNPEPVAPRSDSDDEAMALERGAFNEQRDQWSMAWGDYNRSLKISPMSVPILVSVGRAEIALNRYDDAARFLKEVASASPEAAFYYGVALASFSDHVPDAQAALRTAAKDPAYATAANTQLALLEAREQGSAGTADAANILHTLGANPTAPAHLGGLEVALLRRAGHSHEAQTRLQFWLQKDPADDLLRAERLFNAGVDDPDLWAYLAADPERVLNLAEQYRQMGAYDDALKLLNHEYVAPPPNQREPGAVLPQANPLLLYFRGYCKSKIGQDPRSDFESASKLSTLYVFPHREIDYRVLNAALAQNDTDAVAHDLLGELYMASFRSAEAIGEWQRALALNKDFPAIHRNLGLALLNFENNYTAAQSVLQAGLRLAPKDAEIAHALDRINQLRSSAAAATRTQPTANADARSSRIALTVEAPKGNVAGLALIRSVGDANWANSQFTSINFPNGKQPPFVRQAYIEVQLRGLLNEAMTKGANCEQLIDGLENLDQIKKELPLTDGSFGEFMKRPHYQYYMGMVENLCGAAKAAKKRWARLSKLNEPSDSPDFIFPLLAAKRLGDSDAAQRIEAALHDVIVKNPDQAPPVVLFERGSLLIAKGQTDEGSGLLEKSTHAPDPLIQYLSLAMLAEGPLQ